MNSLKTELLNIKENKDYAISRAADILNASGVVAIPTETVYGLAASAYDDSAIAKVFAAKGRPQDNPLIVHIDSVDMLSDVAVDIPDAAYRLIDAFWPGPLTIVLKRNERVAKSVSAGLDTVAVRCPSHATARQIIKQSGIALAAPSANVSGAPSPTTPEHVIADLSGKIDAIVCDTECDCGVESTVISLVCNPPRLLRPGSVTPEQLSSVLGEVVIDPAVLSELKQGQKAASPGMKYRHYSPNTETVLVEGEIQDFVSFVNAKENCGAVCFSEEYDLIDCKKICYGSGKKPETLANGLFSALREADSLSVERVYVHAPEKSGVGLAVYNRLIRAAAFKVISL